MELQIEFVASDTIHKKIYSEQRVRNETYDLILPLVTISSSSPEAFKEDGQMGMSLSSW